jgi:Flp pilus assembly protein TadD
LAARLHPDFAWGHVALARLLIQKENWERARETLEVAEELESDRWDIHFLHGIFAFHDGFPEEAVAQFRQALTIHPENGETHFRLANVLEAVGELRGAREHFRACVRFGSSDASVDEARRRIARINERIGTE